MQVVNGKDLKEVIAKTIRDLMLFAVCGVSAIIILFLIGGVIAIVQKYSNFFSALFLCSIPILIILGLFLMNLSEKKGEIRYKLSEDYLREQEEEQYRQLNLFKDFNLC